LLAWTTDVGDNSGQQAQFRTSILRSTGHPKKRQLASMRKVQADTQNNACDARPRAARQMPRSTPGPREFLRRAQPPIAFSLTVEMECVQTAD
jgi:hypothetical protein